MNYFWCWVLLTSLAQLIACTTEPSPPCFSEIYCHGPLLHTVQMARIYEDSKTFVDMKMKFPPNETMDKFLQFMETYNDKPNHIVVKNFVEEYFEPAGNEFINWVPKDWIEEPTFLEKIKDTNYKAWGRSLNLIWKDLGRKMKNEVQKEQDLYSIIWVPNPVIVPGGRFREFYYWDSYWIIQGLLLSEMYSTVKGMLENFVYIVDKYGHIPNGGRIYYIGRSQPPLLVPMVKLYIDATKDFDFVTKHINLMDNEFSYWMTNHTKVVEIDGKNYTLAVYGDHSKGPRPESYSEDVDSASIFKEDSKKEAFYSELKAAAESGWDFSSRWFVSNKTNKGNLTDTKTRSIAPVDLNSFIYWNAVLLQEFHELLNNTEKAQYYKSVAQQWLDTVTSVLWHEEVGVWLDYDILNGIKRDYFYASNIAPLWTGCYPKEKNNQILKLVMKYLGNKNIHDHDGGVPMTLEHTGEQWDYPNAWPPLQHMVIVGLENTGDKAAQRLALELASKWVKSNYKTYNETEAMFEKYDVNVIGGYGTGGEYEVQLGFGWTNGVILYLLDHYGDIVTLDEEYVDEIETLNELHKSDASHSYSSISIVGTTAILGIIVVYIGVSIYKRRIGRQTTKKTKERPSRSQYTELSNIAPRHTRTTK